MVKYSLKILIIYLNHTIIRTVIYFVPINNYDADKVIKVDVK